MQRHRHGPRHFRMTTIITRYLRRQHLAGGPPSIEFPPQVCHAHSEAFEHASAHPLARELAHLPDLARRVHLLHRWLEAVDWETSRHFLEQHTHDLVDPITIGLLSIWIRRAEAPRTPLAQDAGAYLRLHRRVLWRTRQRGILWAWAGEEIG